MDKYEGFVGKVLDGRYKILELVGIGGMACVMKAQDLVMNRIVAIKILNDEYNGNEQAEARFIDESKAVAMLSNKYIVSVYDVAIYPDIKYIVMEYLDGITLREYLDNKGALSWKEACVYISQILRALEHAHSKGVVHRDIKPQNVILMKNGDIKVTDFGIAKLPNAVSEQRDERAIGTVYYISPEQACGKETDYYSDIYSVGVMFYEAVTGTLPFIAETPMDVAMMQVKDDPIHPRDIVLDIPVGVSQIILKAMEKSPSDRFMSAHTMVKAIEWVIRNPDVIFAMSSNASDESAGNSSVISIDMIATSELEPYDEDDLSDVIQKTPPITSQPDEKKVKKPSGNNRKKSNAHKKTKKKKKNNSSMFPVIAGVSIAFLIIFVLIGIFVLRDAFTSFTSDNNDVEVQYPNLVGLKYDDIEYKLVNGTYGAKFEVVEKIEEYRSDMEDGVIISTEPEGGHLSRPGADGKLYFTQITVNVLKTKKVPNVSGYSKNEVKTMLSKLGFKVEFADDNSAEYFPYYQNGQAVSSYPVAGSELEIGETVIVYIYSKETSEDTAPLPNLIGMTEADAKKYAEKYAKYDVEFTYTVIDEGENRVISQSIEAGEVNPIGTVVTIEIGVPPEGLPDFVGLTPEEAEEKLSQASPDREISINYYYYIATTESEEYVLEAMIEYEDDCYSFRNALTAVIGCRETETYDEESAIIFQSVKKDTPLTEDVTEIDLIIVQYVSEMPNDSENGEDNTHEDDNAEENP